MGLVDDNVDSKEHIMKKMIECCEELGEHDTPLCTCRDGNLSELEERVKNKRIREESRSYKSIIMNKKQAE